MFGKQKEYKQIAPKWRRIDGRIVRIEGTDLETEDIDIEVDKNANKSKTKAKVKSQTKTKAVDARAKSGAKSNNRGKRGRLLGKRGVSGKDKKKVRINENANSVANTEAAENDENSEKSGLKRSWTHTNLKSGEKEARLHRKEEENEEQNDEEEVCFVCVFMFASVLFLN